MSGPIEVGQRWRWDDGTRITVTEVAERCITYMLVDGGTRPHHIDPSEFLRDFRRVIPLRIRVGVTADGTWMAIGGNIGACDHDTAFKLGEHVSGCSIIAKHWVTAEVPMPEVEQGEVAGKVER